MTRAIARPQAAVRAIPYVAGVSRRLKAEPTQISPLAGKMMLASGTFSAQHASGTLSAPREAVRSPLGRIAGAIAFLSMAVVVGFGDDHRSMGPRPQIASAGFVQADDLFAPGVADSRETRAIEKRSDADVKPPDLVDGQDRFEIGRLNRLRSIVRQD